MILWFSFNFRPFAIVGELGIIRHLLFPMVIFLLWWIYPSTAALCGAIGSSQPSFEQAVLVQIPLFHFQLRTIHWKYKFRTWGLKSTYCYFILWFSALFSATAMPTAAVLFPSCSSLTKRNHALAQLVALLMYLHLIWQLGEQIKPQKQLHFHQMKGRRHLYYQFGHWRQTYLHINIYVFPGPRRAAFMKQVLRDCPEL